MAPPEPRPGRVYLVGAGPGDPDLLTLRAHRLLTRADIVVYDRLVSQAILDLVPPGTSRVFVGKAPRHHPLPQDEINALLVELVQTGRTVVRLKGGDPFIFGRGGEEAAHLARHGIPFEVVPGITAASGCATSLGIPLTHRGVAMGTRFVTGHCKNDQELDLNWESLADPQTTLVVYMGMGNAGELSERLTEAGLPASTPVLAVSAGTLPEQRTCRTTLGALPAAVVEARLPAPVLLIIGEVIAEAERLGLVREEAWAPGEVAGV